MVAATCICSVGVLPADLFNCVPYATEIEHISGMWYPLSHKRVAGTEQLNSCWLAQELHVGG
jgi:hypothetical protein